jgi:hypothetical protein
MVPAPFRGCRSSGLEEYSVALAALRPSKAFDGICEQARFPEWHSMIPKHRALLPVLALVGDGPQSRTASREAAANPASRMKLGGQRALLEVIFFR